MFLGKLPGRTSHSESLIMKLCVDVEKEEGARGKGEVGDGSNDGMRASTHFIRSQSSQVKYEE